MIPENSEEPEIHFYDQVVSTQDVAFDLIAEGRLAVWGSVLAKTQSYGRGQMRRRWVSKPGNIYASLRLPLSPPFDSTAAAIATSVLCARALEKEGFSLMIKWPNDLAMEIQGDYRKVGGILVEEKGESLVAGIGIDVTSAPKVPRDGAALEPGFLGEGRKLEENVSMEGLWRRIVNNMISDYKTSPSFSEQWKREAEAVLLWRGSEVEIFDNQELSHGVLEGLADNGCAILQRGCGILEIQSGSMLKTELTER